MNKILIVDDDIDLLENMRGILSSKGYEVMGLADASELFKTINFFQPDVIILDILLASYDGRELCRKIKNDPGTKHIPVLMFSAHPDAEAFVFAAGAEEFLKKPFDTKTLLGKIENLISNNDLKGNGKENINSK
ncbi:MAG: response regulator [Candidatus Cyclobacteriaceae bacterium M2_1C_046]